MEATYPKEHHQQHNPHNYLMCRMNSTPSPHLTTTYSGKAKSPMTPRPNNECNTLSTTPHFTNDQSQIDNGHFYGTNSSQKEPVYPQDVEFPPWNAEHGSGGMGPSPPKQAQHPYYNPQSFSNPNNPPTNNINIDNITGIPNRFQAYRAPYLEGGGDVGAATMKNEMVPNHLYNRPPPPNRQLLGNPNSPWIPPGNGYHDEFGNRIPPGVAQRKISPSPLGSLPTFNAQQSPSGFLSNSNSYSNNSTPTLNQLLQAPTFMMHQHQSNNSNDVGNLPTSEQGLNRQSPKYPSHYNNSTTFAINHSSNLNHRREGMQFMPDPRSLAQTSPYNSTPSSMVEGDNTFNQTHYRDKYPNYQQSQYTGYNQPPFPNSYNSSHNQNQFLNYSTTLSSQSNYIGQPQLLPLQHTLTDNRYISDGNYNRFERSFENERNQLHHNAQDIDSHLKNSHRMNNTLNPNSPKLLNRMLLSSTPSPHLPLSLVSISQLVPQNQPFTTGINGNLIRNSNYSAEAFPLTTTLTHTSSVTPTNTTYSLLTHQKYEVQVEVSKGEICPSYQNDTSASEGNVTLMTTKTSKRVYNRPKKEGAASKVPRSRDYRKRSKGSSDPQISIPTTLLNNYNSESNSNLSSLTGAQVESNASNNSLHQSLHSPSFNSNPTSTPISFQNIVPSHNSNYAQGNENDVLQSAKDNVSNDCFKYNQSHKNVSTPINLSSYSPDQSSSASFKEENSGNFNSPNWMTKPLLSPNNLSNSPSLSRADKLNHNVRVKKNEPISKLYEFGNEIERKPFLDHLLQFNEQNANPLPFIPTVSKAYVDLYKLYFMVKERGGILMVNQKKLWRDIAAEILDGHSASTSYNLRKQYIKCLLDYECKFELNGADPAPIITQIELSTKKKKKKIDPSMTSTLSHDPLPSSTSMINQEGNSLAILNTQYGQKNLINGQAPFPSSPNTNFMQSQKNNGPNLSQNISGSDRIKVRDPFSDENVSFPHQLQQMTSNNFGNYSNGTFNSMPSLPGMEHHKDYKNNILENNRMPNDIHQMTHAPFNQNLSNSEKLYSADNSQKAGIENQPSYNEYLEKSSNAYHETKPNFLLHSPNMQSHLEKRFSDPIFRNQSIHGSHQHELMQSSLTPSKQLDIKSEYISDHASMESHNHKPETFFKDNETSHNVGSSFYEGNNVNVPPFQPPDFDTFKHSMKPRVDIIQPEYAHRGQRFPFSSNLYQDIPPNVTITENSMDPRSLKYSNSRVCDKNALPNTIPKEVTFPPDSIEATVPKYRRFKKFHSKDLSNIDVKNIRMALKSGVVSLGAQAIDTFSLLQSEESKISQFQLSHCQGLLDLLLEYFHASLVILFQISLPKKDTESSSPHTYANVNFRTVEKEKEKDKYRNGKNYTMVTRNKKPVHIWPSLVTSTAMASRSEYVHNEKEEEECDDNPLRSLPDFNKNITRFRFDLITASAAIQKGTEPSLTAAAVAPEDNSPDNEAALGFAIEEYDSVITYKDSLDDLPIKFVITLSNIFRGISFVPANEATLCKNEALLRITSKLLLLQHSHSKIGLGYSDNDDGGGGRGELRFSWAQARHKNYLLRDCWLTVSKDLMVLLSNISGKLDLQLFPDDLIGTLLRSLTHTLLCPCSTKITHNLTCSPTTNSPTRKFMALEILCKLSVSESNMDYIIATLSLNELEGLIATLVEMLMGKDNETVLKECSLVLLSNLGSGDLSGLVFNLISHTSFSISSIIEFMEEIEGNASRIIHNQGFPTLRDNPELMGTSLSMLRRSANLLLNLAYKTDDKALFFRYQNRLLNLVMSQILDQNVANIIADILYILSLNSADINKV